ncbi:hypothetical protein [Prevotella communis]|nr:hypothetical protein [Prevotella communis]
MKKYLLFTMVAATMVSCAPKVTSEMLTNDFQAQPTNKVMIYGPKDSVPETAKAIGLVTVDGKNTSLRKQYTRAIDLAVKEAARKGGNVLVVDNRELKENRLKGTIAYTDEKIIDSLTLSAYRVSQLQHMPLSKKPADVKQMGDKEQQEIAQQQETTKAVEQEELMSVYLKRDSIYNANPEAYFDLLNEYDDKTGSGTVSNGKSEKKSRGGMIKVGIGPEWNTSKIYYEGSNYLSYIRGNAVSLSVTSTEGKAYGFGFDLYGSITEADIPSYKYSSYEKYDLTLLYLGPSAVFGGHITDRLRMDIVVSTGVAYFQDNDYTQIGIGLKSALGLEYMVSKNAGIGLDLLGITSIFGNPSGARLPKDESYGYQQLGLMLSGRFHF